ncbi:MAG: hypothetical protein BMS9Abin02_0186 [Anaerolineae bacterium]|nr:MAG: hypothetical protein BMS9Abin02_0186 [Anaerolineae bacterium]
MPSSFSLVTVPVIRSTGLPCLNNITVGRPITPWFITWFRLASVSSRATTNIPEYSPAISSKMGSIALHGPHHSTQKSTKTGLLDFSTSYMPHPPAYRRTTASYPSTLRIARCREQTFEGIKHGSGTDRGRADDTKDPQHE